MLRLYKSLRRSVSLETFFVLLALLVLPGGVAVSSLLGAAFLHEHKVRRLFFTSPPPTSNGCHAYGLFGAAAF